MTAFVYDDTLTGLPVHHPGGRHFDAFTGTSPPLEPAHVDDTPDPQRDAPPGVAVAALRWAPKPSAVAVAVAVIGTVAATRRGRRGRTPRG